MLPVADPDLGGAKQGSAGGGRQRWSWRRPKLRAPQGFGASLLRIGTLAGAAAAMGALVLNLVSSTPVFSFGLSAQRWASIKQGIVDFDPLGFVNTSGGQVALGFERPLGPPAVLHPERLRPFTAVYSTTYHRFREPTTPPGSHTAPDVLYRLRTMSPGGNLVLEQISTPTWGNRHPARLELSATTLTPISWTDVRHRSGGVGESGDYTFDELTTITIDRAGGVLHTVTSVENPVGTIPSWILDQVERSTRSPIVPPSAPVTVGSEGHLMLIFQAVALSEGWRGSVESWRSMVEGQPQKWYRRSYEVEESATITVPAGTFDTWVIRGYYFGGERSGVYYLRKSDGLLLRVTLGESAELTGRYPSSSSIMELQSITYP
jgi:hypothetical protein